MPPTLPIGPMIGQRFGRWVVVSYHGFVGNRRRWNCICDCGTQKAVDQYNLRKSLSMSCGCLEKDRPHAVIHGQTGKGRKRGPEHACWSGMKARCTNPKSVSWPRYGGRGVKVCDRWMNSFVDFLADIGRRPSAQHSLDRHPDNVGNYEPGNVRWATAKEQKANTSRQQIEPRLRSNNTSGHRCVFWNKKINKWYVHIGARGKVHNFGYYNRFDDAFSAYNAGASAIWDEYCINAMEGQRHG